MTLTAALLLSLLAQDVKISGEAGWRGRVRGGCAAPVSIDLDNVSKDTIECRLTLVWAWSRGSQPGDTTTLDRLNGRDGLTHEMAVILAPRARRRASLVMHAPHRSGQSVWIYAIRGDKLLAMGEFPVRHVEPESALVAIVGGASPFGIEAPDRQAVWLEPDGLPDDWRAYNAIDALIWLNASADNVRSPAQLDAVRTWVGAGGRLIVARADAVGLKRTAIIDMLPVTLGTSTQLEGLAGLGPLVGRSDGPQGPFAAMGSKVRRGTALVTQSGVPLVVEAPHGAGTVAYVAVNPEAPAFESWAGTPALWNRLVPFTRAASEDVPRGIASVGLDDLAELPGRFPNVAVPAMGTLLGIMVVFLIVVSPFDYFVLRRLRRPEATWITFPLYAILFTGLIMLIGSRYMRTTAIQRDIVVADHYSDAQVCRRRVLSGILAPYAFSAECDDARPLSSQLAATRRYGLPEPEAGRIIHDGVARTVDWRLQRGATGITSADRCTVEAPPIEFTIEEGETASIRIKNSSDTPYEGALIFTPQGTYEFGDVPTGEALRQVKRLSAKPGTYDARKSIATTADGRSPSELKLLSAAAELLTTISTREQAQGLARELYAGKWVRDGGHLLVAFPRRCTSHVVYRPEPKLRTTVTIARVFQRAQP